MYKNSHPNNNDFSEKKGKDTLILTPFNYTKAARQLHYLLMVTFIFTPFKGIRY